MKRLSVALTMAALLSAACSSGEVSSPDTGPTAPATATLDASDQTSEALDQSAMTSEPDTSPTIEDSVTGSAEPTVEEAVEEQPASEPTEEQRQPPRPEPEPCSGDALSNDLLGYAGAVRVITCEQGWAYAYYPEGDGDAEFIAQRQGGTWVRIATLGSPMCQEEFWELGAPASVTVDVLPCDVMYPPEGANPLLPDEDCVIPTEQFGATYASLIGISCDDAASRWYAAADNNPPSFETPIVRDGWECWVYPYDPGTWIAGSCKAIGGSASFFLNRQ